MQQDRKPAALSSADARYLINQWCSRGFFRVRGLGGKIAVEEVVPCSSYTIRLKSQYEDRSVRERTVPFPGGPVDDRGSPPGPWSIHVERPSDFQDRTVEVPIPHTEHVHTCPHCAGRCRVTCGQCQGFGKVTCPQCNGSGRRTRMETRQVRNAQGFMVPETVQVQESCGCFGGKIGCGGCQGQGTVVCGDCGGHGRVKTFKQLDVHFRVDPQTHAVHDTKLPDELLEQAGGEVLFDERGAPAVRCPSLEQRVDDRLAGLLKETQSVPEGKTRLLFQHLHVEYVGIQEVRYRYRGSPLKTLWIYGSDQRIHAPGVPRPWAKLLAIVLGGVLAVAAVIALIAGLH